VTPSSFGRQGSSSSKAAEGFVHNREHPVDSPSFLSVDFSQENVEIHFHKGDLGVTPSFDPAHSASETFSAKAF
jgi:hypothetical protein